MGNLTVMIGLPGLGKSTIAERAVKEKGTIVVSSDDLRGTLLKDVNRQDENNLIFILMREMTVIALKAGKNVIYDATNLWEDKRRRMVKEIKEEVKEQYPRLEVIGNYCIGDYKDAFAYNNRRDRKVPEDVILRMTKQFDIPTARDKDYIDEINYSTILKPGYSSIGEILIAKNYEEFNRLMCQNVRLYEHVIDLPQDCPYHTLSVSRHIYAAFEYARDNTPLNILPYKNELLFALAFHDIGKATCKEFRRDSRFAHFTNHEKVSAQILMAEAMRHPVLKDTINYEFAAALIKEHSFPYEEKNADEYCCALDDIQRIYGEDFRNCLEFFRKCDKSAH